MKKIIYRVLLIAIMLILLLQLKSFAGVVVSTDKQVETDSGNVTISITSKQALGAYTLKLVDTAGLTLVSASGSQVSSDNKTITGASDSGTTTLGSFTFKVPSVTQDTKYNIKFSITGMETPDLESVEDETNTAVLTVKAKPQEPEEKPTNTQTPETTTKPETQKPTTPTVVEPKFTDANKTMYATGDINLRASWSTSSTATSIEKGTELKITGTSTEKVNGYVWYRVSYNGVTKYVASNLLTSNKPEENKIEEEKKSDNAYLKNLTIEGYELFPVFNKETTSYTMQISDDVTELNIKAEKEDEKATVEIKGNKDLKEGANTVTISVNAEDNTIKIYEITVTKSEKVPLGLKTLKIVNTDIEKTFKPDLYNYEIDIGNITKLDIEAIANNETATVEILGNEELQDGENTITIIVSSKDGEEKVTYQIKANKIIENINSANTVVDADIVKKGISPKVYLYIGLVATLLIALIIVIVYVIEHRNKEEYEYTDNIESLPESLEENGEEVKNDNSNEQEEINTYNFNKQEEVNKDIEQEINDESELNERKAKIDYFLDNAEEQEKPKRKKGKHF